MEQATVLLEGLTDADWEKTTAAENWTVAVTAHHIASSYESATRLIETIAAGRTLPHFTRAMLDEMNARHAQQFAGCTRAETIALHQKGARRRRQSCGASRIASWPEPGPCSRGCHR